MTDTVKPLIDESRASINGQEQTVPKGSNPLFNVSQELIIRSKQRMTF